MSKLLIQESPLTFQPSLAVAIGINEAIVLQQVHYWISNPRNKGYEQDGFKWVYNTYAEWKETNFPFWSENTIQRTFSNLEDLELIISIQPMKSKYDRTKYYRIDYTKLDMFDDPKLVRSLNESETTTKKTTENKKQEAQKPDFRNLHPSKYRTIPEIKTFIDATGWIPGSFVLETVYEFVSAGLTKEAISAAFKEWTARSYKPGNVKGYLTWARDGIPAAYGNAQVDTGAKPAINTVAVEATKQLLDNKFSGNFVPRPAHVQPPQIRKDS